jgi:hypothetical protein
MYKILFFSALLAVSAFSLQVNVVEAAIHDKAEVEALVRETFANTPVMIEVAKCESSFRQYTDGGSVFRGGAGGEMVGVFQFYGSVHAVTALTLGFNIDTLEGNVGYAKHLYESSGTDPWKSCVPVVINTSTYSNAQLLAKIELLKQLVSLLQQLLALQQASR